MKRLMGKLRCTPQEEASATEVFHGLRHPIPSGTTCLRFCLILGVCLLTPLMATATTYYLSPSGSDAPGIGGSAAHPWLTPNHTLNCGDVIQAVASSSYAYYNFTKGKWGQVNNCASGNGESVAWLKCATFDGCIISSGGGMWIDQSNWGVQGWQVTATLIDAGCFSAAPTGYTSIHHIIFANNIAYGCMAGGFISFDTVFKQGISYTAVSVDYLSIIGNIAYDSAKGSDQCYSGISVYQPVNTNLSDTGTHIYVAGNFSYGNNEPTPTCGGIPTPGADGIIFDTFDGDQGGYYNGTKVVAALPVYTGGALADNNILINNNGNGIAVQNNGNGYTGQNESNGTNAAITIRHNTSWDNGNSTKTSNALCSEILINTGRYIEEYTNIAQPHVNVGCGKNSDYAVWVYEGDDTDYIGNNVLFSPYGTEYEYVEAQFDSSFVYDKSANYSTTPKFHDAIPPAAPNCGGGSYSSVPACMSSPSNNVVGDYMSGSYQYYGYQVPSNSSIHDPLFPQWMCNVTLPAGLVTRGCS